MSYQSACSQLTPVQQLNLDPWKAGPPPSIFFTTRFNRFPLCHRNEQLASSPPRHYEHLKRFKRYVKILRYVKNIQKWFGVDIKMSGHGGHQSKRKTLEMPDELCLSDIAGRPACACRWQGTYTRLVRLKGYKASAYCKQAADTLHAIIPQYRILLSILKVLSIVRQLQCLLHLKENEEYINPVG